MVYPQHWLLQWGGSLGDPPQEIWSNGIRFGTATGSLIGEPQFSAPSVMASFATKLAAKMPLTPGGGGLGYSLHARLEWVKWNEIGPDGKYANSAVSNTWTVNPGVRGVANGVGSLLQASLAVSWMTPIQRGLANSGRIYIPMPGVTVDPVTLRVSSTVVSQLALNWANFIDDLSDMPGLDLSTLKPSVVSGTREGARQPITSVRIGDVVDTMRSRRSAVRENYQIQDVPGTQA